MRRSSYFQLAFFLLFWQALGIAAIDLDHVPIEAKLVHALQAIRVKVGDPVLARVQVKWQGAECSLREGAIVRGHWSVRPLAQRRRCRKSRFCSTAPNAMEVR